MTDCPEQLTFDFHWRQAVVADFDGGLISSDAGLLPLRQLDERLGWTAAVADLLGDSRQAGKVNHALTAVPRLYRFCEDNGLEYLIGFAASEPLKQRTKWALDWLNERFRRDGEECR